MPAKDREELIRARAHGLWEQEGRPEGANERHWLQAAAEVDEGAGKAAPKKAAKAPAKPKAAAAPKAAAPKAKAAKPAAAKKAKAAK